MRRRIASLGFNPNRTADSIRVEFAEPQNPRILERVQYPYLSGMYSICVFYHMRPLLAIGPYTKFLTSMYPYGNGVYGDTRLHSEFGSMASRRRSSIAMMRHLR